MLSRLRIATRRHPRTTAVAVVGLFVAIIAAPLLVIGPTDLTGGTGRFDFSTLIQGIPWQVALTGIIASIIGLIAWWDYTLILRPIGQPVRSALGAIAAFPLVGILLFTVLLSSIDGAPHPISALGLVLCLNLFVALSEELLFRGVLFGALRQKSSLLSATIVSSVAFGCLHLLNAGIGQSLTDTVFQVVNATALGVLFCAVMLQGSSLWPAILLHMIWNSYAMLGVAAAEFSGEIPTTTVETQALSSASFVLPATITLLACAVLYQYIKRTGHKLSDVVPVA